MYSKLRRLVIACALAVLATGVSACDIAIDGHGGLNFDVASGKAQDEWSRTYTVAPSGRLELININGKITAEASDGAAIEIKAERKAKAMSDDAARELLGKIEMREEVGADRVRVEVRAPRLSGASGHEIQWTVKVPRGVAVDLRTTNGGVRMVGLKGDIRARSVNGGITATGLQATGLDASVTNGGVDIELVSAVAEGTFDLEAVNGGVSLTLPGDSKADITGRCVNGGVTVTELPVEVLGEQTRRRIDGKLNGGGAKISLETVNGGVRIGKLVSTT
jgi:putative adhesin